MKTTLKIKEITSERNGWGMPKILVNSSEDITVINRGYNCFEAVNPIDEAGLMPLIDHFKDSKEDTLFLEIHGPNKKTCAWYSLKVSDFYGNRINW